MTPFRPAEAAPFDEKYAESLTALALDPSQHAAVTLVGDATVIAQLHPTARRTPRPRDGDRGQATLLYLIRSGAMCMFAHATLHSVSPNVRGNSGSCWQFHRFFP